MNSLIASLQGLWDRTKAFMVEGLKRVEDSALFEKMVLEYDSLELRQQKWIQASLVILLMTTLILIFALPFWNVWHQKGILESSRDLVSEMRRFQEESSVVHKPAPRPRGFQALPASNADEFEESLKQFVGSIDLAGDLSEISSDKGVIKLSIPELSIRQALAIVFQTDGWFPAVRTEKLSIEVNPENKELLKMEAEFKFTEAFQAQAGSDTGGGGRSGFGSGNSADSSDDGDTGGGRSSFPGMSPPPTGGAGYPSDDFDSDLPNPNFEEDM